MEKIHRSEGQNILAEFIIPSVSNLPRSGKGNQRIIGGVFRYFHTDTFQLAIELQDAGVEK